MDWASVSTTGQVTGPSVEQAREQVQYIRATLERARDRLPTDTQSGVGLALDLMDRGAERMTGAALTAHVIDLVGSDLRPDHLQSAGWLASMYVCLGSATDREQRQEPDAAAYRQARDIMERMWSSARRSARYAQ